MTTSRQLAAIVAGTASIVATQLFASVGNFHHTLTRSPESGFLAFVLAEPSLAQSNAPYVPPISRNPQRSQGSGSRGCDRSLPGNLVTLLIPANDYAAQTVSGHPTFYWHMSQSVSVPAKFVVLEPGVTKPVFEKQIDAPKAGINQMKLPEELPELQPGRQYRWSVSLICNAKRPSVNPFFYSWIERVPPTSELTQKLAAATSQRDKAAIYAGAGQWYDALEVLAANSEDSSSREYFLTLLNQVGLTQVTQQARQQVVRQ